MRTLLAITMSLYSIVSFAQTDLYLCPNPDAPSGKEYKNTGNTAGCRKIDLPGFTTPPYKQPKIYFEKAKIGMSKDSVVKEVGKPLNVRKVETRSGVTEKWFYPGGRVLTFSNGSLEVIEK